MKKKLLYGLVGLLFALSLAGFVACDDDDDDDGDGTVTTTKTTNNGDGTTTTTTTKTYSDGSSESTATTTDEEGNVTSSSTTTTDSEGNTTVTETEYSTDDDGNEVQETTATFSDGSTASTEKTVTSDTTATVTVYPSANGVIELVSADELEGHKSITLKVTDCSTDGTWLLLSSSANWDNKIEAFVEWDSDGSIVDDFEYTIDASTLVTWEVYFEGGLFISGDIDSLTIEYTISDTIAGTAYTVEIDGKTGYSTSWTKLSDMSGVGDFQLIVQVPGGSDYIYVSNTGEGAVNDGEYVYYFTGNQGFDYDVAMRTIWNIDLDETVWLYDPVDDYWYETNASCFSDGLWIYSTSTEAIVWLGTRE